MTDILDDARETLAEITERRPLQTHYDGCRRDHTGCLIAAMIREIARLRLTDAEREAIADALEANESEASLFSCEVAAKHAATLRGLLDRTRNSA